MKTYILRMDFSVGFIEILFQTDSRIPFVNGDFYYPEHSLTENQLNALWKICGRDFQNSFPFLDRFSVSEKVIHTVTL